jgi:hypothetical protein
MVAIGLCCGSVTALAQDTNQVPEATAVPGSPKTEPATVPAPQNGSAVWEQVRRYLPEPGQFAVIPGSELRSVLVRSDEFAFCGQIDCARSSNVLDAWNGGAFDSVRGEFRVHGGGHADYGGNEIYLFDFSTLKWTRETEPQPLTGPLMGDNDGDGSADSCPTPAIGPPAMHTYQGFLYVPKIDRYWLLGTAGYCKNGTAGGRAWEFDAGAKVWTRMPEMELFARFTRAMVDPESGNLLIHVGRRSGWFEVDPATRRVVRSFEKDPFGAYLDGPAVFDERRRVIYALVGGRPSDQLLAYSWPSGGGNEFRARLVVEWPREGKKAWGIALHSSGLLVLWDGNARIIVIDPESGKVKEATTKGFRPGSARADDRARRVYSKWSYIPEIDAFFGITDPDLGIVLYRLDARAD